VLGRGQFTYRFIILAENLIIQSMNKILNGLICVAFLASCNGNPPVKNKSNNSVIDSIKNRKSIDSQMASGDRPDGGQEGPTFDEVKDDLLSKYNNVERIDTLMIIGKDSLHILEKYYCLHDSALVVPKKYLWGGDKSKDFVTHNFASNIVIIKNRDTIISKTFRVSDFNNVIFPEEKKYAILFSSNFLGYKKQYNSIVFGYSITIPLTDVGVPAYIAIDTKGGYKTLDEYVKMDEN
jgi:hypothetical protein